MHQPRRSMLKSKLHRLTVTEADLHYEGSLTIDKQLLDLADIVEFEEIHVWNVTRGTRLVTYAMEGEPGSRVVCVNGAGAHLAKPGDLIIVASFTQVDADAVADHQPTIILMGENNQIDEQSA